jgi:hypothetical protein
MWYYYKTSLEQISNAVASKKIGNCSRATDFYLVFTKRGLL